MNASGQARSRSVEDFLKAVYVLQQDLPDPDGRVSTNAVKSALDITAPSVTDMAQRLVEDDLIDYVKYRGMRLTKNGERVALHVIRRHRLIELYLVQELGYALHEVHEEAENLEHAVSDRFVRAIAHKMNNPEIDPHGDPIPAIDGTMVERDLYPLVDLPLEIPARVSRFITTDSDMLQHTIDRGFALEAELEVVHRDPFDGPLTVRLKDGDTIIGHAVAMTILVEKIES